MKRGLRITLFTLAGALLTGIVVMTAVCLYLRTESGSKFLLSKVKQLLKSYDGTDLQYKSGYVDPFSHIHFENLVLLQGSGENRKEIRVRVIDILYKISFLSRTIDFENILIDEPDILMRTLAKAPEAPKEPPAPFNIEEKLEQARSWVTSPKVSVTIKDFTLNHLKLDMSYRDPASQMTAKVQDLGTKFRMKILPSTVFFAGEFAFAANVMLASEQNGTRMEATAMPFGSGKASATIRKDDKWIYQIEPSNVKFGSTKSSVAQLAKGSETRAVLNDLKMDADWRLVAKTTTLFKPDPHSFETVNVKNTLSTGNAIVDLKKNGTRSLATFESIKVNSDAVLDKELALNSHLVVNKVYSQQALKKPVQLDWNLVANITRDLADIKGKNVARIDSIPLLNVDIVGKHSEESTALTGQGQAAVDPRLATILKSADSLKKIGTLAAKFEFSSKIKDTIEGDTMVQLTQSKKGTLLAFEPMLIKAHVAKSAQKIEAKADIQTKAIRAQKITIRELATSVEGSYEKNDIEAKGVVKIRNQEALKFDAKTTIEDANVAVKATFEALFGDYLEGILTRKQLAQYGRWRIKSDVTLDGKMPASKGGSFVKEGELEGGGSTVVTQIKRPDLGAYGVSMEKPIVVNHKLALNHGKARIDIDGEVPALDLQKIAKVSNTRLISSTRIVDLSTMKDFDTELEVKQGNVVIAKEMSKDAPVLAGLNMNMKATVRNDRFSLDKFSAEFNNLMFILSAEASGHMRRQDFQTQGMLTVEVPKNFPAINGQKISGKADFPWTLAVYRGRDLSFDGHLEMRNLAWSKGPQRVRGISGRVPVSEKLVREGVKVKFASLINQNPFERVDYERMRPLIHNAEQVRIEEIGFEEKTYGPFVGFFSMRQNMIFAHQFDFNLGKSGLAHGELYFDVYPANLQMGFLSRLTQLDLVELLPKKYLPKMPKGDRNVSGRSGIVVNLNRGSVDGRVDITEIGGSQLITLINVLDPKYEDDKMNLTRSALGVGYPTFVQMSFQKGYLDMGVDVSVFGVSKRFDVRGIPVATLVSSATADIVKKTKEGPLK